MYETVCDPYGKAAFPVVVKCDGCGERIESGWMPCEFVMRDGVSHKIIDEQHHYCDECSNRGEQWMTEFRTCDSCHSVIRDGFTADGGTWYCCDECFEEQMYEDYPLGWRGNEHDDDFCWDGGYYDFLGEDGKWHDTGIYWTQWD